MSSSEARVSPLNPTLNEPRSKLLKIAKRRSLPEPIVVLLGALFMTWPAFYNRFPLMYPDTLDYVRAGHFIARALFFHRIMSYYGLRSSIYSLGILPFALGGRVWPVVAFQCLLTSFVLWLVVRSIVPHNPANRFLVFMLLLSLFSSVSWYGSLVMPDILGPVLYLCVYLLVFAREALSIPERFALYLISWWAIASHATHLLIVVTLCALLAFLAFLRKGQLRKHLKVAAELTTIIALSIGAQVAVETLLYGEPSLNGPRPPFLTARLIADGPGRWYLEKNCGDAQWEMCRYLNHLSGNSDQFLWDADGVWKRASADSHLRILSQEKSFSIAVLRAYPLEEFEKAASNFRNQLLAFGVIDLRRYSTVADYIGEVLPREREKYFASLQAQDRLPSRLFSNIQYGIVVLSLLSILAFLPRLWRSPSPRLLGLSFVIFPTVIVNALVTGTLSSVNDRYQCRLIWLVPCLAGLCALEWKASRSENVGWSTKP
jgi:hypothetical protein